MTPSGNFKQYLHLAVRHRPVLQRLFFILVLILLTWYGFTGQLLFQLKGNPLFYQELDPTYWLFMTLGISHWLQSDGIIVLDLLLFVAATGAAVWPQQVFFPLLFAAAHFIWFVLYHGAFGHHYAFYGVLFVSLPFIFNRGFGPMLLFCRFAFCFIYGSAAIWKIVRGNLSYPDQTRISLISLNTDVLAGKDDALRSQMLQWLVAHPLPAHSLWIIMIGLEFAFLSGFFTLRFDKWLGTAYLLFALGGWYFFGIWNHENLLFLLTLLPALKAVSLISKNKAKIPS